MQQFVQTQRSVHTRRAYENDLKQYLGYIRAEKVAGDSFDTLLAYREWMVRPEYEGGKGLTRTSANRKFATIRSFLNWLQARGKVKENPSLWVKNFRAKPKPHPSLQRYRSSRHPFPPERAMRGKDRANALGDAAHLVLLRSPARGSSWLWKQGTSVRGRVGDKNVLTIRVPGKGDKERILPVPAKIERLLEKYMMKKGLEIGGQGYLFSPVKNNVTGLKDKPIASQAVYYVVKKYAHMAGVDRRVSPHSCRATCISNALDHAASHRSVQQLAGWKHPHDRALR